jgi:hypothetical protein
MSDDARTPTRLGGVANRGKSKGKGRLPDFLIVGAC